MSTFTYASAPPGETISSDQVSGYGDIATGKVEGALRYLPLGAPLIWLCLAFYNMV